ncbi:MAG TPA: chorismate mutase [Acidimicrobiales bacterium]|nr:chorismate mutase [Acidimicrobiales bacterium]
MPQVVRALRGATAVDEDTAEQVAERTTELLGELLVRNGVAHDDLISILFTATPDVRSMFPAAAARTLGLGAVPLLCATEIDVAGAMPRVLRVLLHLHTERPRDALHHVYLHGTSLLRDDLPD